MDQPRNRARKTITKNWENYYELQGLKPTATCEECGFKELYVLTSFTPPEVLTSPLPPPPSWYCLNRLSPEGCMSTQGRRPEPTRINWGYASKDCASIPQDTAEHNRQELVVFCQGCWRVTDFQHHGGTTASFDLMIKLKLDACRSDGGTQGRLRGALISQESAKHVEYCLKPGKAPCLEKLPNELLKTMSDEEFLIMQAWVHEILTLPEKPIHTARQSRSTMNGTIF